MSGLGLRGYRDGDLAALIELFRDAVRIVAEQTVTRRGEMLRNYRMEKALG